MSEMVDVLHESEKGVPTDGGAASGVATAPAGGSGRPKKRSGRICLLQKKDGTWKAFDDVTGLELDAKRCSKHE